MNHFSIDADFTIGFLGAGQLARMSALEAFRFGFKVAVYSEGEATHPVDYMTPFIHKGAFDNVEKLIAFAKTCDVITLENEFLDSTILKEVRDKSGTPIYPTPESFAKIENKLIEKQTFEHAGIAVPPYRLIKDIADGEAFAQEHGYPFVLKSSKGGYDGYGNETVKNSNEFATAFDNLGGTKGHDIIAEAFVNFTKELAVQVVRNKDGIKVYPCCETIQVDHICKTVISPAPVPVELRAEAEDIAIQAMEAIDAIGIFTFEFFLTEDFQILLNESAPRPHNSGHYTIEGCITSQFENHIRAITGMPLGDISLRKPVCVMENILGTHKRPAKVENVLPTLRAADTHLHIYGKNESKIGRKMGHLTVLGDTFIDTIAKAKILSERIHI